MFVQFSYFIEDYKKMVGRRKIRALHLWMSRVGVALFLYRLERGLFLSLGRAWEIMRVLFLPILNLLYAYTNCDLNYKADIGPGLLILHPAVGIVVSGKFSIGKNLILTGGNVIGAKGAPDRNVYTIGNNCSLGANAVILGPIILGNNIQIGAMALVIHDAANNSILVGVPAKNIATS